MILLLSTAAGSYGVFIVKALVALTVIAGAAWALVRFGGPRLRRRGGSAMRVLERLPLEPRRSLYIVEVDGKRLLLGVSEGSVRLVERLDGVSRSVTGDDDS